MKEENIKLLGEGAQNEHNENKTMVKANRDSNRIELIIPRHCGVSGREISPPTTSPKTLVACLLPASAESFPTSSRDVIDSPD